MPANSLRRQRFWLAALCVGAAIFAAGCVELGILNPQFAAALGLSPGAATLPGEAPAVLAVVENRTNRVVEMVLSSRREDEEVRFDFFTLPPDSSRALALVCPVEELTLGDVTDLDRIGALVRLGNGAAADPFIEVEPFGILLKDGQNFNCGDSVTFAVAPSGATPSGYQIFAFIDRSN